MKQKKIVLVVVVVFALLLAGAYPLYNSLSGESENAGNQLVVLPQGNKPGGKPAETEPSKPAETDPSSPAETDPSKPEGTELSDPTEPKPTEPKPTEPKPTEPKPTEPIPTEPKPTEPAPTEPKPTEPAPTEPKPTEPAPTEPKPTEPKPTEPAPTEPKPTEPPVELKYDFTVTDGNGKSVKLSDYVGKPIVLNFWASWCGPCKSEMPEFQEVYEEMGDEVQFLMVNATVSGDTVAGAKSFIQQYGYTFPVLFDTTGEALQVYGVDAFPTTWFLDKEGNPVVYAVGAISKASLLQGIGMIQN